MVRPAVDQMNFTNQISQHFEDVFELVVILSVFFIALSGWRRLVIGKANFASIKTIPFFTTWCGLACAVIFVETLHLIQAITWACTLVFSIVGFVGYFINRQRESIQITASVFSQKNLLVIAIIVSWAYIVSSKIMIPQLHYDVDLYYLQTIKWFNEFPVTLGLGNLHSRLGFNQSLFSVAALLNIFPLWNHGLPASNFFLLLISLSTVGYVLNGVDASRSVLILLFVGTCLDFLYKAASPSPDASVAYLQAPIFGVLIRLFSEKSTTDIERSDSLCGLLLVLGTLSIMLKLSSVVFVAASFAISIKKIKHWINHDNCSAKRIISLCVLLFLIHCGRGYLLTGYPLYPSTMLGWTDAVWSLPIETVHNEVAWIYTAARQSGKLPDEVLNNWNWLPVWLSALPLRVWIISVLSGIFVLANLCPLQRSSRNTDESGMTAKMTGLTLIYVPLVTSLLFWFFTAPDLRFLGLIPELFLILSAYLCALKLKKLDCCRPYWRSIKCGLMLILSAWVVSFFANLRIEQGILIFLGVKQFYLKSRDPDVEYLIQFIASRFASTAITGIRAYYSVVKLVLATAIISQIALSMGFFWQDQSGWHRNQPRAFTQATISGFEINIPVTSDQCGGTALPCAPGVNPQLKNIKPMIQRFGVSNQSFSFGSK